MINHKVQFEKVESTFEEVQEEYQKFKKNVSYENRNNLKRKVNKHRETLTNLLTCVNNIFLKGD